MSSSVARPVVAAVFATLSFPVISSAASAQSAGLYVNAVTIEIVPSGMAKFQAALKDNATATIQEAGCHELDVMATSKDPNQVFIFEAYNNAAAWNAHQTTAHFLKFYALTAQMMNKLDIRPFTSVAMNANGTAGAAAGPLFVQAVDLDIVPAQFDAYMTAAKANAAASVQDSGNREFDISVLQKDPHHVLLFEVYDNAAALSAHEATDHFKQYDATTKDMVSNRVTNQYTTVGVYMKSQ